MNAAAQSSGYCEAALVGSGVLEFFNKNSVVFGALTVDNNLKQYTEALLVQCEIIQLLSDTFGSGPGFFHFETYSNTDAHTECDAKVAFSHGTGGFKVTVADAFTLPLPGRGTAGLVADKTKHDGWAIDHLHESLDIEAIIEYALDGYFGQENNAELEEQKADGAVFEEKISKLGDEKKAAWREHVGAKYCKY